jgi:hypothetical protein
LFKFKSSANWYKKPIKKIRSIVNITTSKNLIVFELKI